MIEYSSQGNVGPAGQGHKAGALTIVRIWAVSAHSLVPFWEFGKSDLSDTRQFCTKSAQAVDLVRVVFRSGAKERSKE